MDLETTDKNPNTAEMLTAYLRTRTLNDFEIIDDLHLTFRPEMYLHESYSIHKISREESNMFNDKWDSLRKLLNYMRLHKDGLFCCHANHLVFGAYGYFDQQVIRQVCSSQSREAYLWYLRQKFRWISTHTIAKSSMYLPNYGLDNVASYFGFDFNHHDCKSDVEVTEKIFKEMVSLDITKEELINLGDYKNGSNKRNGEQSQTKLEI